MQGTFLKNLTKIRHCIYADCIGRSEFIIYFSYTKLSFITIPGTVSRADQPKSLGVPHYNINEFIGSLYSNLGIFITEYEKRFT